MPLESNHGNNEILDWQLAFSFVFDQFECFVFQVDTTAWQSGQSKIEMDICLGGDTQW